MGQDEMVLQNNLVPPKKRTEVKEAVKKGTTGAAFRQKPKTESALESPGRGSVEGQPEQKEEISRQFIMAVKNGFYDEVKEFLEAGIDPNTKEPRKQDAGVMHGIMNTTSDAVSWAAHRGHKQIVELLISYGAGIEGREMAVVTPLTEACKMGHLEIVRLLIKHKANLDYLAPLVHAAKENNHKIIEELISAGADIDVRTKIGDRTALMEAAEYGAENAVETLVTGGADLDITNSTGKTTLDIARERGFESIIEMLK